MLLRWPGLLSALPLRMGLLATAAAFAQTSLLQKPLTRALFETKTADIPAWRRSHVGNTAFVLPGQNGAGKWRLYLRGSGDHPDGYHDNIGMFEQDTAGFNPLGGWKEDSANPILKNGAFDAIDGMHLLDVSIAVGPDHAIYLYYMARTTSNRASISGSKSVDGGLAFTKFADNPLRQDTGPSGALYADGKYYVYTGFGNPLELYVSVSDKPDQMNPDVVKVIGIGAPGAYDGASVNGAKIFKVSGDPRWFMLYQVSAKSFDYPERFHAAYSTDLIHWTKIQNSQPLMVRGEKGTWDQGAIWTGGVFEYQGSLYVYYEGWGAYSSEGDRDQAYYFPGGSRVGVATVKSADFLKWAGGAVVSLAPGIRSGSNRGSIGRLSAFRNYLGRRISLNIHQPR